MANISPSPNEVFHARYPFRRILDLIGDKWTPIVIYCLSERIRRFGELQRRIPGISKKMLTQILRRLERDGLVQRTVYAVGPPRTEYGLTKLGRRLQEPIADLCRWALEHEHDLAAIEARRAGTKENEGKF